MSRTKKAEISAELDLLHISSLRDEGDSDRQALDKLIARLDKLSLMGSEDDMKDEQKVRRLHNAIAQEKWMYFALCKLPIVYSYEDMVSILRKSITDLSAFDRQRKRQIDKPIEKKQQDVINPWADEPNKKAPPPLEALFNQQGNAKRSCFNCEKEGCMLGRCTEPMNLKRIAINLEKFKKEKADRTNNNKWKAKKTYLMELQPDRDDWFDVYEVIVTEALLSQLCHNDDDVANDAESNCTKAFSKVEESESLNDNIKRAFQNSVGNGDPDEPDSHFTSLFDLMTVPPSMRINDANTATIDYSAYVEFRPVDVSEMNTQKLNRHTNYDLSEMNTQNCNHHSHAMSANYDTYGTSNLDIIYNPVSYTHLTLPTILLV